MQVNAGVAREGARLEYKWIVAMIVVIGVFMSILDQTIVNIAIPRLQTAFGADIHSVQWVLTAYILTQGVITPTAGYFADKFGTKRFYMISLAAFTIGSALCGLAWNLPVLIFFRIVQGAGGAALFPLSITMLFREFPPQERGLASGLFGIPALLAPALGPTFGGYLVTYAGWQAIFYVNVPVGIVAVILVGIFIRETHLEAGLRFDFLGFIFAALGLSMLLYGLSDASTNGWTSGIVLGFIIGGVLMLAIFTAIELMLAGRGKQPLLDLRLFRNGPFRTSIIASVFVIFSLFGGIFLFPIYLQSIRGLSAFQAGLILLPQAFASMVSVIIGGRLVDRLGVRAVMVPGLIVLGFVTWQLTLITTNSPYWWLQLMLIVRGLGLGLCIQPLTVAGLSEISSRQLPQASSLNTVARAVSSSLGIAVLATLVQTQTQVHFGHLAEQVTASSRLGQLLPGIQARFVARGLDFNSAHAASLQLIARLLQRQSFVFSIRDAFSFSLVIVGFAIISVFFVRSSRKNKKVQTPRTPVATPSTEVPAEAKEEDVRHLVLVE